MAKFNIVVTYTEQTIYSVKAEDWPEAVEKASEMAVTAGLETVGAFRVLDENGDPVDTWL